MSPQITALGSTPPQRDGHTRLALACYYYVLNPFIELIEG